MGVQKEGEKYLCEVCGNEVVVTKVGGGELVCCEQPMKLLGKSETEEEKTEEQTEEKEEEQAEKQE
jgi:desulfoferrodoxin-like iron-binding protein